MRPVLHPALIRTWRDESTLQIGATPALAVVMGGLGPVERAVLEAMNGLHDVAALRAIALEAGGEPAAADRLVDALTSSGVIVDHAADGHRPHHTKMTAEGRSAPDRWSVGLQDRSPDGGRAAFGAREHRRVDVYGAGRIGARIARLLAAAGIGDVTVHDKTPVRAKDACPGGFDVAAIGRPRGRTIDRLLRSDAPGPSDPPGRAAGSGEVTAPDADVDLAVLALGPGAGRSEAADLLRHGVAHLFVDVVEVTGVVGPLVVPGESSCMRCHDLHRADRDRHWPLVLDQLVQRPPAEPACDTSLAAAVAGLAAVQALAHLDGFVAATVDGTIEIDLPYGLPRRRSWDRHPGCGCGWG